MGIGTTSIGANILGVAGNAIFGTGANSILTLNAGTIYNPILATTTIPALQNAWSISTTTSATPPLFSLDGLNGRVGIWNATPKTLFHVGNAQATSTFDGGLDVANGAILHDWASGLTSIDNLTLGALSFDTDAGILSWADLPVTSAASANTVESYTAQIDGNPLLTVYAESSGGGGIQKPRVGVASSTPWGTLAVEMGTSTDYAFVVADAGTTTPIFAINPSGYVGLATRTPFAQLSIARAANIAGLVVASSTDSRYDLIVWPSGRVGIGVGSGADSDTNNVLTVGTACAATGDNSCVDVAEFFAASEPVDRGDIVMLDENASSTVKKGTNQNPANVIGVVSSDPAVLLEGNSVGIMAGGYRLNPLKPAIALAGRVPVKVSTESGPIVAGDRIRISSLSGVGMKATTSSYAVGIALAAFDPANGANGEGEVTQASVPDGSSVYVGKVFVFVNLGYAHLDGGLAAVAEDANSLWTVDQKSGRLSTTFGLDLGGQDIANVRAILSASGAWSIDENGNLTTESVTTKKLCLEDVCVTKDQLKTLLENASMGSASAAVAAPFLEPPPDAPSSLSSETPSSPPSDEAGDTGGTPPPPAEPEPPPPPPVPEPTPPPESALPPESAPPPPPPENTPPVPEPVAPSGEITPSP